jgi:hypothetical protein
MELLPRDVVHDIFRSLGSKTRADVCSVSRWFYRIALDVSMMKWCEIDRNLPKLPVKKSFILSILGCWHRFVRCRYPMELNLKLACAGGDLDIVKQHIFVPMVVDTWFGMNTPMIQDGLVSASKYGRTEVVSWLLRNARCSEDALSKSARYAGCRGHIDVIHLLGKYGSALLGACDGNNIEVVKMVFIHQGEIENDILASCLYVVGKNGYLDIFKLLVEFSYVTNEMLDDVLRTACDNNHPDVVKYAVQMGAKNITESFEIACGHGFMKIVKYFVKNKSVVDVQSGYNVAHNHMQLKVMDYLTLHGAKYSKPEERIDDLDLLANWEF